MKQFALSILSFCYFLLCFSSFAFAGVEILSKSKVQRCEKGSGSDELNCTRKVVLNMAVPSGTSGRDSSIVAEIVEVEENSTDYMQTLRTPPVITINKSAAYALYQLTYIRDVAYKPVEYYVKTRKCEPDANEHVVQICERPVLLQDENGHVIQHSEPICCPCGPRRRVPSSCGNFFDKLVKGKANTAHCVRFPGDWFHVFGIGQRSVGFSVKIEVKVGSTVSEVILGPENRTATSKDNFLRVNLIGDFVGYSSIPSFEDFYLVVPRQGDSGQQELGRNFSMWMLLERVRFTLDGVDCNKVGVSYEAFSGQSDFCSSPYWSCLHNQLWNFWNADQNRISRKQQPLYVVEGRFQRVNEHPNAGTHSFSIGITEVLNTNLLMELRADDIEYVYQRSPGKIVGVTVPTFETLTQFGIATITAQNIGEVEASYSLTLHCSTGVSLMEEQFFIMKPNEIATQSFKLYPTTDQAASYVCSAILKDSNFNEVDRANCQFSTTATTLDNGSQIGPFMPPGTGQNGFVEFFRTLWNKMWEALSDFITGETCRRKCSGFFDFRCHIQYICFSWMMMFGLLLAIFPTVLVLIWLLHQKGFFDPLYDWWEDHLGDQKHRRHDHNDLNHHIHHGKKHHHHGHHHKHWTTHHRRRSIHVQHNKHLGTDADYNYYHLHHVNKDRSKHHQRRSRKSSVVHDARLGEMGDDGVRHHGHRGKRERRGGRN
ncbi:Protein HAPLESS 2 [Linum perenne]